MQGGAAAAEQEVVELEAANEPAVTGDGPIFAGISNVTGAPFPKTARKIARRQRQCVPDRRRQPSRAQLDAGKVGAINDRHVGAALGQETRACAARWSADDDDHVVSHARSSLRGTPKEHMLGLPLIVVVLTRLKRTPSSADVGDCPVVSSPHQSLHNSERASMLARGVTIGRYVILALVGRGGMGEVYTAYNPELDPRGAIQPFP